MKKRRLPNLKVKKIPIQTKTAGNDQWKFPTLKATPGSLYIHVPFCKKKCPYCHFFVLPHEAQAVNSYLDGVELEWELSKHLIGDILTIYLGGGTPSLLTPDEVHRILSLFPKVHPSAQEITLEANPEDVSLEKMKLYKELGINRVSIGVQSLDDSTLLTIGRHHGAPKAVQAVFDTYNAGIENISIDLMYDLPSQTLSSWKKTVDKAVTLPIQHLSLYNLTLEIGSLYHKQRKTIAPRMPKDATSSAMLSYAVQTLQENSFTRYEISAFCKQNRISQHNIGYWTARPFLGLGPSAFSYINGTRSKNISHLAKWKKSLEIGLLPIDFQETLPHPDNLHELLAVGLRVAKGVDIANLQDLPTSTKNLLNSLTERGLLKKNGTNFSLTERGKLFYDDVASEII